METTENTEQAAVEISTGSAAIDEKSTDTSVPPVSSSSSTEETTATLAPPTDKASQGATSSRRQPGQRPLSLVSASLCAYLRCLEEVLVWLLAAEERLAAMPDIGNSTAVLKEQFHDLEVSFTMTLCMHILVSVRE